MSQLNNANTAYSAALQMVSSLQAIVMLYDGILKAVHEAKQAIEESRIEDRFHATQRASKIVLGLQANLDFDRGGDVALVLDRYYHRLFRDLQKVNLANSATICQELIGSVAEVRGSWKVLADQDRAEKASQKAAAGSTPAQEPQAVSANPVTFSV